jgi:hypothetical protein
MSCKTDMQRLLRLSREASWLFVRRVLREQSLSQGLPLSAAIRHVVLLWSMRPKASRHEPQCEARLRSNTARRRLTCRGGLAAPSW